MNNLYIVFTLLLLSQSCTTKNSNENKEAVKFFMEEVLGNNKLELYKKYHSDNFIGHSGTITFNLEQDYQAAVDNRSGIPDFTLKVIKLVAEDDMVVAHWSASGSNTGTNSYLPNASGKKIEVEGITIFRMKNGKISEEWGLTNLFQVLSKNGLLSGS